MPSAGPTTTDTAPPFAPLQVGKPWTELRGCRGLPSKRPRPRGRHPWRPRAQTVCVCCCRSAQPESPIHRVAAPFLNHQPIFRPPIANRCLRLLLHHCGKGTVELPGHGLENTLRPDRLAFRLHLGAASTASKKKIIVAFVPPDGKLRRGTRLFCLRAEGFVRDYSAHWILEPYLSTEYYCQKKSLVSAQYRATGKPVCLASYTVPGCSRLLHLCVSCCSTVLLLLHMALRPRGRRGTDPSRREALCEELASEYRI